MEETTSQTFKRALLKIQVSAMSGAKAGTVKIGISGPTTVRMKAKPGRRVLTL
jgi:hypothetical protein